MATCPALKGCVSQGRTRRQTLKNIKEAIELYLEPTEDDYIPEERSEVLELAL